MHEEKLQEIERRKRADAERAAKMQAKREAVKASRLARAGKKPGAAKEGADDEETARSTHRVGIGCAQG